MVSEVTAAFASSLLQRPRRDASCCQTVSVAVYCTKANCVVMPLLTLFVWVLQIEAAEPVPGAPGE